MYQLVGFSKMRALPQANKERIFKKFVCTKFSNRRKANFILNERDAQFRLCVPDHEQAKRFENIKAVFNLNLTRLVRLNSHAVRLNGPRQRENFYV